jgi:hypothetical protein
MDDLLLAPTSDVYARLVNCHVRYRIVTVRMRSFSSAPACNCKVASASPASIPTQKMLISRLFALSESNLIFIFLSGAFFSCFSACRSVQVNGLFD